jgi:transposase-like protein
LPPSQRTLAKTAEIVGKSRNLLKHWSAEYDWVMRAEIWDRAQQRVADAARLEEIDRINRKAVEVGEAMLDAVIAHISAAAKALDRSPHALARWAEVGAKLSRDGLGVGERTTVAGAPNAPVQHELSGILDHLTPGQVLQAREVALMLTEVKSRIANGLPPIDTTAQP